MWPQAVRRKSLTGRHRRHTVRWRLGNVLLPTPSGPYSDCRVLGEERGKADFRRATPNQVYERCWQQQESGRGVALQTSTLCHAARRWAAFGVDEMLATPRLRLHHWDSRHRNAFAALHSDIEVMADLGGPISKPASSDKFDRYTAAFKSHGVSRWAVRILTANSWVTLA